MKKTEFEEDEEAEESVQASKAAQRPVTKLPIMPLAMAPKHELKEQSMLWATHQTTSLKATSSVVPQPEQGVWQAYIPSTDDVVRSKPHPSQQLPVLASRDLWAISESKATSLSASPMWSASITPKAMPSLTSLPKNNRFMWTPRPVQVDDHTSGLFSLDVQRAEFAHTCYSCSKLHGSWSSVIKFFLFRLLPGVQESVGTYANFGEEEQSMDTSTLSTKAPAQTVWAPAPKVESVAIIGLFSTPRHSI